MSSVPKQTYLCRGMYRVYNWRLGEVWLKLIYPGRVRVSRKEYSVHVLREVHLMRNVTVICYLCSLLSFRIGYLKMLAYKNAIVEHVNTYDYTVDLSLATSFLVLTIFLAVIGFTFYILEIREHKKMPRRNTTSKDSELAFMEGKTGCSVKKKGTCPTLSIS